MPITAKLPALPSDDKRWKIVNATMRRLGNQPHALIETLHQVQSSFGYLDETALQFVAEGLRVPLSRVYGVATFYHYFQMKPQGEHTCVVCTGTACFIKGVPELLKAVRENYGLELGETSPDGKVSLLSARCLGACGLAPLVVFDGEFVGKVTPEIMVERIGRWMEKPCCQKS